jgi:hypothetical protein
MAVDYNTYSGWSSKMQARYRQRYGQAPQKPFTPWQLPTSPPPGSYDPALDAQLRAEQRGYGDLQAQNATNSLYSGQDYQTGQARENQSYANQMADIAQGRTRTNEDYGTATGNLVRSFQQLGQSQRGSINAAGLGGGALRMALSRRNENQGIQQGALDTTHNRALEDYSTQTDRTYDAHRNNLADLLTNYTRGQGQQATQEGIAGRELGLSSNDIGAEKIYAATQAGYDPLATRPANEYTRRQVTYRKVGSQRYLPSGKRVSLKTLQSMYR